MWGHYFFVFLGSFLVDVVPFPLPPAFTVMVYFQMKYNLNIWTVVLIGVPASILGRTILTLYIPYVSDRIFSKAKNEDVRFLGNKLKEKGWKSHAFVLAYSLMPLPTTPLFIAGGMARMKWYMMIPAFTIGKFASDLTAVWLGKYAAENTERLLEGIISWKSITGMIVGLLLVCALIFVDWRTLLINKKLRLKFHVWAEKVKL